MRNDVYIVAIDYAPTALSFQISRNAVVLASAVGTEFAYYDPVTGRSIVLLQNVTLDASAEDGCIIQVHAAARLALRDCEIGAELTVQGSATQVDIGRSKIGTRATFFAAGPRRIIVSDATLGDDVLVDAQDDLFIMKSQLADKAHVSASVGANNAVEATARVVEELGAQADMTQIDPQLMDLLRGV